MREYVKHPYGHSYVYHQTDHVIRDLDERPCGQSRVDFHFSSVSGTRAPKTVENTTMQNKESPTAKVRA